MKNLIKILPVLIIGIYSYVFNQLCFADNPSYKLTVTNLIFTSQNSLEFEIQLLNTGSEKDELKYSLGQYFFEFNPKIANGGNLTYSIVNSELPESMRPRNPSIAGNVLQLAANSIPVNKESLPLIPNQKPGLLIARMRLETSSEKFNPDEQMNLKWTDEQNKMKTKLAAYNGKENFEMTNAENHISELDNSDNIKSEKNKLLPAEFSLSQNYPNPFNPVTQIKFEIPKLSFVKLTVYDITGRQIAILINQELQPERYEIKFDGNNFASGIYFYKIQTKDYSKTMRMVLIK